MNTNQVAERFLSKTDGDDGLDLAELAVLGQCVEGRIRQALAVAFAARPARRPHDVEAVAHLAFAFFRAQPSEPIAEGDLSLVSARHDAKWRRSHECFRYLLASQDVGVFRDAVLAAVMSANALLVRVVDESEVQ